MHTDIHNPDDRPEHDDSTATSEPLRMHGTEIATDAPPPAAALAAFSRLARPPADAPRVLVAWSALSSGLQHLRSHCAEVSVLARAISSLPQVALLNLQAPGTPAQAMFGRVHENFTWAALLRIGARTEHADVQILSALAAAELIDSALRGRHPSAKLLARIATSVSNPNSLTATAWAPDVRLRQLSRKVCALRAAVAKAPVVAADLGLTATAPVTRSAESANARLNRALQGRMADQIYNASIKARRAVSGHGAADPISLAAVGQLLRSATEANDDASTRDCLAVLTGMTDATLSLLPLSDMPDESGTHPDMWIDLAESCLWSRLTARFDDDDGERGRPPGATGLTVTTRMRVGLPAWLCGRIRTRLERCPMGPRTLGDLLPEPAQQRRRLDSPTGPAYAVSVPRLRRELTNGLLNAGAHRHVVGLALHMPYLVSAGRGAYGAVAQRRIDDTLQAACDHLGWGEAARSPVGVAARWIGSRRTPTDDALRAIATALAAPLQARGASKAIDPIRSHNDVTALVGFHLALCLALRGRDIYPLPDDVLSATSVLVHDKGVAHGDGVGVPVVQTLREALSLWQRSAARLRLHLEEKCDDEARRLLAHIAHVERDPGRPPVWHLDSAMRVIGVGAPTWRQRLSPALMVAANAGRHWWATRLTERGVPQVLIDALMRHEASGLAAAAETSPWPPALLRTRLAEAMEAELTALRLPSLEGLS